MEEESESVVVCVADCPEFFGRWVVFHVAEVFKTFFVVAVAVDEVFFVNFEGVGEDSEEGEQDVVVDVLLMMLESNCVSRSLAWRHDVKVVNGMQLHVEESLRGCTHQ